MGPIYSVRSPSEIIVLAAGGRDVVSCTDYVGKCVGRPGCGRNEFAPLHG